MISGKSILRAHRERLREARSGFLATFGGRPRLAAVLRQIDAHKALGTAREQAYIAERDAAWVAEFARRHPKRKTPERWPFGLDVEVAQEIGKRLHDAWQPRADAWRAEHKRLEELRDGLARQLTPSPGSLRVLFDTIYASSYNSQGWGAESYARAAAELRADIARHHGIAVEVVQGGASVRAFEVYVQVADQLDLTILKYAPGPTLRDSVRLCWKRGANPRVFNPYLPHGYEASVGIDYQGRDLRAGGM